uniref:Uncharacterized protein n=1 Tax=Panagrolaimus sp. PS1159 TaxID=55785 RepID=A0AC35ESM7_9BILA
MNREYKNDRFTKSYGGYDRKNHGDKPYDRDNRRQPYSNRPARTYTNQAWQHKKQKQQQQQKEKFESKSNIALVNSTMNREYKNDRFTKSYGGYDRKNHGDKPYDRNNRRQPYSNRPAKTYTNQAWQHQKQKQQQKEKEKFESKSNIALGVVYKISDSQLKKYLKPNGNVWECSDWRGLQNLTNQVKD